VHIDKTQLREMAAEVDELHNESMRTFREEAGELHFGAARRDSRRSFMKKAGVSGALITVGSALVPITRFMPAAWAQEGPDDAAIAKFAATFERAAVSAYGVAAKSGKLSDAAVTVGTLFAKHHTDHALAFEGILKSDPVEPNSQILADFGPLLQGAADQAAILEIAFTVEQAAAATYLFALGLLDDPANAGATATILPVEAQHAVVLGTILKKDIGAYMPAFQNTEGNAAIDKYLAAVK
jgi:rubrerythrin